MPLPRTSGMPSPPDSVASPPVRTAAPGGLDRRPGVPAERAGAVLDLAPGDCLEPLDEARMAGLVDVGDPPGHRFVHALIRDAIEAGLSSAERVLLHRRVAEVLEVQSDRRAAAPVRPRPALGARRDGWRAAPCGHLDRTGRRRGPAGARPRGARRLYRLALSIGRGRLDPATECRLTLGLARALHLCGDDAGWLDAQVTASGLAGERSRPDLLAQAALAADAVGPTATEEPTRRLCRETLAALPPTRSRCGRRSPHGSPRPASTPPGTPKTPSTTTRKPRPRPAPTRSRWRNGAATGRAAGGAAGAPVARSAPEGLDERERLAERMLALGRETGGHTNADVGPTLVDRRRLRARRPAARHPGAGGAGAVRRGGPRPARTLRAPPLPGRAGPGPGPLRRRDRARRQAFAEIS